MIALDLLCATGAIRGGMPFFRWQQHVFDSSNLLRSIVTQKWPLLKNILYEIQTNWFLLILMYFCLFEIFTITYQSYTRDSFVCYLFVCLYIYHHSSELFHFYTWNSLSNDRFICFKKYALNWLWAFIFIIDKLNVWFRLVKDVTSCYVFLLVVVVFFFFG